MDTAVIETKELNKRGFLRASNELSTNDNWQRQRSHNEIRGSRISMLRDKRFRFTPTLFPIVQRTAQYVARMLGGVRASPISISLSTGYSIAVSNYLTFKYLYIIPNNCSLSNGFDIKSTHPCFNANSLSDSLEQAVWAIIGKKGN